MRTGFGFGVLAILLLGASVPAEAVPFRETGLTILADGARYGFRVELAETPQQRRQGLQGRKGLAAYGGMLFDFGKVQPVAMWMKNTLIPLDMLFISRDGTIDSIAHRTEPLSLEIIRSENPVRAVLEIRGGTAESLGIRAGHRVVHWLFGNEKDTDSGPR